MYARIMQIYMHEVSLMDRRNKTKPALELLGL